MLNRIVKKISLSFCNNNIINKEDIEIYEYGLEILILTVFEVVSIILISMFLNKLLMTLLFILSFCSLRMFAGGYHAKTSIHCYLEFLSVYIVYLILQHLPLPLAVIPIAISAISELIVLLYAPIDNENKRLSTENTKRCRLISILVVSVGTLAVVILSLTKSNFTYCISLGQLAAAILLLAVKIKTRKEL
jgi:accessory gene regulator B